MSVRLLLIGVAIGGVLDTNESRGTRDDAVFVVETLGIENRCTLQRHEPPDPQPCFVVVFVLSLCVGLMFAKV